MDCEDISVATIFYWVYIILKPVWAKNLFVNRFYYELWTLFPLYSAQEVIYLLFYAYPDQKLTRNPH